MIQGNTKLPIFMASHISRDNVGEVLGLNPSGIILGSAVVNDRRILRRNKILC